MIHTANLTHSTSRKAGGLHESVRRLVQSLADAGVGVRVLAVEDEFTQRDLAIWHPVRVDVFPRTGPKSFGYSPGFIKALNEEHPGLIHTHGIWTYSSVATTAYCTRRRVPCTWSRRTACWIHGRCVIINGRRVLAYALYERKHVRGASCIRALCESEARSIRELKLKNPIAVIPNGIDLPQLDRVRERNAPAPWSEGLEPGRKVLLFLGRVHRKKGLTNLLRAWAAYRNTGTLSQSSDQWMLAIAGWDQGNYEAELKKLCSELQLQWADLNTDRDASPTEFSRGTSVLFLGPRFNEAKEACYLHCDGFILPSFSEGLPMAVLEAWAYGKPVLMTPECNLPDGFEAGAALKIETSVEAIAEGLRVVASLSDNALGEMGGRGRMLAEEKFAWPKIALRMKATYEWMLGGGTSPDWFFNG